MSPILEKLGDSIIFNLVPVPIFYKDTQNNLLRVNDAFLKLFGYSREEVEGKSAFDIFDEKAAQKYYADDLEVINSKKEMSSVLEIRKCPNGEFICLTDRIPYFNKEGYVAGVIGFTIDITKQSKLEVEILRLKKAIEQSPSTVIITDTEGKIVYVNPKFSQITGYHYTEVLNKNPNILKSGKMDSETYKDLWDTITSGKIWRGEFLNKTKNGSLYWEVASVSPVKNEQGEIVNYIKVAEIVTELRETLMNLWSVLDFANYFVVVLDSDMQIRMCNRTLAHFLGFEDEHNIIGKPWADFILRQELELVKYIHNSLISNPKETHKEVTTELKNLSGKVVTVKWFSSLVNKKYHFSFNLGIPVQSDAIQSSIENTREFFEDVIVKHKLTLKAIQTKLDEEKIK